MCRTIAEGGRRCARNLHDAARTDAARAVRRATATLQADDATPRARTFATQTLTRARFAQDGGTPADAVLDDVGRIRPDPRTFHVDDVAEWRDTNRVYDQYAADHGLSGLRRADRHAAVIAHATAAYDEQFGSAEQYGYDAPPGSTGDHGSDAAAVLEVAAVRTKVQSTARVADAYLAQQGNPGDRSPTRAALANARAQVASWTSAWAEGFSYSRDGTGNREMAAIQAAASRFSENGYHLPDDPNPVDRYVAAQYDVTQRFLARRGITHVELHRGYAWGVSDATGYADPPPAWATDLDEDGTDRVIPHNPVASWSTSERVAEFFSGDDGSSVRTDQSAYGVVVSSRVPAHRILSFPNTGMGCLKEQEVTVLAPRPDDGPAGASVRIRPTGDEDRMIELLIDEDDLDDPTPEDVPLLPWAR